MRKIKYLIALSGLAASAVSGNASAWEYDDATNDVFISGAACRAATGTDEAKVYHFPGSTTVKSSYSEVRLYCPIARRNLHAYDEQLLNDRDVKLNGVTVYLSSGANAECRLFGKNASTGSVHYGAWTQPLSWADIIWMNVVIDWDSYSWGLQCDVGGNESIKSIQTNVTYNNL